MIVDDNAAVAIENPAPWRHDGQGLDTVTLGSLVINFRAFDLQFPETRDEKQKNRHCNILKSCKFRRRKTGIVPLFKRMNCRNTLFGLGFYGGKAHG
jgi:hypothetical protein